MADSYPSDWDNRRKKVYERDDYKCQNCGALGGPHGNTELHAHHGVPISKGGSHKLGNLKTYCNKCHHAIHNDNATAPESESHDYTPFDTIDCPNCGESGLESQGLSIDSLINIECRDCNAKFKTTRGWNNNNNTWVLVQGQDRLTGLNLARRDWESLNQLRVDLSPVEQKVHDFAQLHLHEKIVSKSEEVDFAEIVEERRNGSNNTILNPEHTIWNDYLGIDSVSDTVSEIDSILNKFDENNLISRKELEPDEYENADEYQRLLIKDIPSEETVINYANEIGEKVDIENGKISNQRIDPIFIIISSGFTVMILIVFIGILLI